MANMNFGVNILPKANNTYSLGNSNYKWNIYANTINGTAVSELGLPTVDSTNNGQILQVDNGEWTVGAAKLNASEKGVANGVASLDSTGKVPTSQLPAIGSGLPSVTSADNGKSLDVISGQWAVGAEKLDKNYVLSTEPKTWNGFTSVDGYNIWSDGDNIYYSYNSDQYILNKSTSTWSVKEWTGLTNFVGNRVWSDGDNIYYSTSVSHYVLDKSTSTWSTKTWNGLTNFFGDDVWTDGNNIYYNRDSDKYILDKSTSTWSTQIWNIDFGGSGVWTDGDNIYYSNNSSQYVLDKSTSTWNPKTWTGLTNFNGYDIWSGEGNIYYSSGQNHYVLDKSTSTWSVKTWGELGYFYGRYIWTDGSNTYYSCDSDQYIMQIGDLRILLGNNNVFENVPVSRLVELFDSGLPAITSADEGKILKVDNGAWGMTSDLTLTNGDLILSTTLSKGRKANTTVGTDSIAFGVNVTASGNYSQAFGDTTIASGYGSFASGILTNASGLGSHAEGLGMYDDNNAPDEAYGARGLYSHVEGKETSAFRQYTHAQGYGADAIGVGSHAEGYYSGANGMFSHAGGIYGFAYGDGSFSHGLYTQAYGAGSYALGSCNAEDIPFAAWEANHQYAVGDIVWYRGTGNSYNDRAFYSNGLHYYKCKTANSDAAFDITKWDEHVYGKFIETIGNGAYDWENETELYFSNARALDWQGNEYLNGDLYVNCENDSTGGNKVATELYVTTAISNIIIPTKVSDLTNDSGFLTSVPVMTGATSSAAGTAGLVPAPASADREKFFRGDGTWQDGGKPMVILSYGNSTWNDFIEAYNNNVLVYCRASSNANPKTGSQTRMAFMAYVNNSETPTTVEFQYYRSVNPNQKSASQMSDQVFVYTLTNANGGTWSVTTRQASIQSIAAASGSKIGVSYSNSAVTLSNTMTAADMPMSSSDATTAKAAIDTLNSKSTNKLKLVEGIAKIVNTVTTTTGYCAYVEFDVSSLIDPSKVAYILTAGVGVNPAGVFMSVAQGYNGNTGIWNAYMLFYNDQTIAANTDIWVKLLAVD